MAQRHFHCRDCGAVLDSTNWAPSFRVRKIKQCRSCLALSRKANRERDRAAERRRYQARGRFKPYDLTPDEYDALLARQGGVCAICRTRPPTDIDHDHATGQVRGLLCRACNLLLGMANDTTERLRAAISYLIDPPA